MTQLLICDWLLETRVSLWEDLSDSESCTKPVANSVLSAFQKDLSSLRTLAQHMPVSFWLRCILLKKIIYFNFSLHYQEFFFMKLQRE